MRFKDFSNGGAIFKNRQNWLQELYMINEIHLHTQDTALEIST